MSAADPRIDQPPPSYLYRKEGEVLVRLGGFLLDDSPGNPALPYRVYRIALPPDADLGTLALEVIHLEEQRLPEAVRIVPAPPLVHDQAPEPEEPIDEEYWTELSAWGFGKNIVEGHNALVYERDALYPAAYAGVYSAGQMRKWRIASVVFHPLRYNPVRNEAYLATRLSVKVTYERDPAYLDDEKARRLLRDDAFDGLARRLVLNYDQARRSYDRMLTAVLEKERLQPPAAEEPPKDPGYAIITTEATVDGSARLEDFCFHKQDLGYSVIVVTETTTRTVSLTDDGYEFSESSGGYGEGPLGERPQRIQEWLEDNYLDGIRYVLLVGDPDPDNAEEDDHVGDLPMVMAWREPGREHPTDLYYSDLGDDTNWNLDGDEYIGEGVPFDGASKLPEGVTGEEFSVLWEGKLKVEAAATSASAKLAVYTDGQTQVWLDQDLNGIDDADLVLDDPNEHKPFRTELTVTLTLPQLTEDLYAADFPLRIEYRQSEGHAYMEVLPPKTSTPGATVAFKTEADLDGLEAQYFNNDNLTGEPVVSKVDEIDIETSTWPLAFFAPSGDRGPGGVDFLPEVFVGRIPLYDEDADGLPDVAILDEILEKIIAYEQASYEEEAWRRRILCSTPNMYDWDDDGEDEIADYLGCETLRNEVASPPLWDWYRIHDENFGVDAEVQSGCSYGGTVAGWNDGQGRGLVLWRTHGWEYGATRVFWAGNCSALDDDRPSFVIQATCGNGWPEVRNNSSRAYPLGYYLLKQGAVATISASRASRSGVFDPDEYSIASKRNDDLLFYLAKGILENVPVGETLAEVRAADAAAPDDEYHQVLKWGQVFNYNLYGDPSLSLFGSEPRANNDVVFLLDGSGSMLSEGKWTTAKDAAVLFYELMAELRYPAHHDRYSAVVFRCIGGDDECTVLPPGGLREVTVPLSVDDFDPYTPLGAYYTPIGGGLELAISELDLDSEESFYSQKFIVLLSDGKHNCGVDPLAVTVPDDVVVHTVGLGEDSIEPATIEDIALASGGEFRISPSPHEIEDFFLQILTDTSWKLQDVPVTDGAVPIDQHRAAFVAVWDDPVMSVSFDLDPPGTEADITPSDPGDWCTYHAADEGETHAFYACDGIPDDLLGDWEFVNLNDDGDPVPLDQVLLKVIEDPRVIAEFDVAAADHVTGQPLVLSARITENGQPMTGLTEVYADLARSPAMAVGTLMARNEPAPGRPPVPPKGVDRTPWSYYLNGVMDHLGIDSLSTTDGGPIAFNDEGKGADARAGDGIYTGLFTDTRYEGSYTFRFRARGANRAGVAFERGQTLSAHVRFAPSATKTSVETVSVETRAGEKMATATVRITPRDALGEYLGPLRADQIQVWSSQGTIQSGLEDARNGSYELSLVYPPGTEPLISVAVGEDLVADRVPVGRKTRNLGFSLHLGRTIPAGTFNRSHDPGNSVALDFETPIRPRLSVVTVAGYHQFEGRAGRTDTHWLSFSGNLKLELRSIRARRLFVSGGLGAYVPESGTTRAGADLGLGFELSVGSNLDLEAAVEYHRIFTRGSDVDFFVPRLGLVLHF